MTNPVDRSRGLYHRLGVFLIVYYQNHPAPKDNISVYEVLFM